MRTVPFVICATLASCIDDQPTTDVETQPLIGSGPISGGFLSAYGIEGPQQAQTAVAIVDKMAANGMDTIIVHATKARPSCGAEIQWMPGMDPSFTGSTIEAIFDRADQLGMRVYVGLVSYAMYVETQPTCGAPWLLADFPYELGFHSTTAVLSMVRSFGNRPSFAGWYIPDEPGEPNTLEKRNYFRSIHNAIRAGDPNPQHQILVSPYFEDAANPISLITRGNDAKCFLDTTGIDVLVWQDGVGGFAIPLQGGGGSGGASVEERFQAISAKVGAAHLWADTELFNYGADVTSAIRLQYRPASAMRINRQLWETRSSITAKRVAWLPQAHLFGYQPTPATPQSYPEVGRLLDSYRALYGYGGTVHPFTYSWGTPARPEHPDPTTTKLNDTVTANPALGSNNSGWAGVLGNAVINLDLGGIKPVSWVAVHTMKNGGWGIEVPTSINIRTRNSVTAPWVNLGTFARPATVAGDREYTIANTTKLAASGRYFSITLANAPNTWTFMSELEVVGP